MTFPYDMLTSETHWRRWPVITVTKLNDRDIIINCDLIELIETTPDTTLTMTTGRKILVLDSVDEVLEKIIVFKGRINRVKAE